MRELWEEFEAGETIEAKYAITMDKIQPILLNDITGGKAWREHEVTLDKIMNRNKNTGDGGEQLWQYANGLEHSPVAPAGTYVPPKSVGNGETFPHDLVGMEQLHEGLRPLAEQVAFRLRKHHMKCTTLQLTIRDPHFRDICRQRPLSAPTCTALELLRAATDILADCWNENSPVRALTLTAQSLIPEDQAVEQFNLFDTAAPERRAKRETLERTMDQLRAKYGTDKI